MLYSPLIKPGMLMAGGAAQPPLTHCLDFERDTSQGLVITDAAQTGLEFAGGVFTVEGWLKFESVPTSDGQYWLLFSKRGDAGDSVFSYTVFLWRNGGVNYLQLDMHKNNTEFDAVRWAWAPATGAWIHFAIATVMAVNPVAQHEFFLETVSQGNGSVVANASNATIQDTAKPFRIAYDSRAPKFDGRMSDWRVWTEARSQAQIAANWKTVQAGTETNLLSNWKLTTGSGVVATDNVVATGNDMDFVNGPTWVADTPY